VVRKEVSEKMKVGLTEKTRIRRGADRKVGGV